MNQISINTLVYNNNPNLEKTSNNGPLDVNSLIKTSNMDFEKIDNFDANYIISKKKHRRERVLIAYKQIYMSCIEKIKLLSDCGKTDMIFEIPDRYDDTIDYIPSYCVSYIENKLKENFMDVTRLDKKVLFVTWKYIELNKELQSKND